MIYQTDNSRFIETVLLKKSLHIEKKLTKSLGTFLKVRFHHDTMAEQGWATKHELIEIEFDERVIKDLILILKNKKESHDLGTLYHSLSKTPGEKGKVAAREYLKTENPHLIYTAFCSSLDLLKGGEIAKQAARDFLKTENPHLIHWAFCSCLNILNGEEIAKQAVRDFLKTENPYLHKEAFCSCFVALDIEMESIALKIIKNYKTANWSFVFHSLSILNKSSKHKNLLNEVVFEIINDKKKEWVKYRELLKIPLFDNFIWVKETEYLINSWSHQTGSKRNYLFSLFNNSYKEFPEKLNKMSIGIIRNWRVELTTKSKHKEYFTRCLANINVSGAENLKAEVVEICKEICDFHKKNPLILTPSLEEWLKKIATTGEFPKWRSEEQTTIETN